ncbi:hypothetical protein RRF57_008980 [Xylaria bambusicola]|uniref:Protein kinase domain-containing protein n=1 Tax=Xylaria bambusicola TaxID=326684 RepID=A0AAN7UW68_9PEZI
MHDLLEYGTPLRMRQRLGAHLITTHQIIRGSLPTRRLLFPFYYTPFGKMKYREPQYVPVDDVETIENYETGGYHPIHIGDRLGPKDRFKIVNKLGYGGHSTVWLAQDEAEGRYVALKVTVAALSHISREQSILQELEEPLRFEPSVGVPKLRAIFSHAGPNGVHTCLATDPCGCSVARSRLASDDIWFFDLAVSRKITAQLIRTVAFLHSQGIAHGDLHPGNVLFKLPDLSSMTISDLYDKYGEPIKEDVIRRDGAPLSAHVPQYVVCPAWLGKACEDVTLEDAEVTLTDFGEAWKPADTPRYTLNTPALYRPPEAMFAQAQQIPISLAADIWTLGCTIFAVIGRSDLFEGFFPNEDDVFAENISALGNPPQIWLDLWQARPKFFDVHGEWMANSSRGIARKYRSLEERADYSFKRDQPSKLGDEVPADHTGQQSQLGGEKTPGHDAKPDQSSQLGDEEMTGHDTKPGQSSESGQGVEDINSIELDQQSKLGDEELVDRLAEEVAEEMAEKLDKKLIAKFAGKLVEKLFKLVEKRADHSIKPDPSESRNEARDGYSVKPDQQSGLGDEEMVDCGIEPELSEVGEEKVVDHSIKPNQRSELGEEEMADLLSMLRSMLRWRPEERVSADDLVKGAWMTKWGNKTD